MPIFSRRRLQAMLTDLGTFVDEAKVNKLRSQLETDDVDQVLPTEMELALTWALMNLGEFEAEPEWFGNGRVPDAYTEALYPGQPAVVEVAALSDGGLLQEKLMQRATQKICDAANTIMPGAGKHLFVQFLEQGRYIRGKYIRHRKVHDAFVLSQDLQQRLRDWLSAETLSASEPLRLTTDETDVVVSWRPKAQWLDVNYFSAMPAEVTSLTDNPLYSVLKRKRGQLENPDFDGLRCLFLADVGSSLLRDSPTLDRLNRTFSGPQIIENFLRKSNPGFDTVCVFSPVRPPRRVNQYLQPPPQWSIRVFQRPGFTRNPDGLKSLVSSLPAPRFEGYQVRDLQKQNAFRPNDSIWYLGTTVHTTETTMTIKVSSRAVLDLIAGRITHAQFQHHTGLHGLPNKPNFFTMCLERGEAVSNVSFRPAGLDEDDDWLEFTFKRDPAAGALVNSASASTWVNEPPLAGPET